ncbi:hypothetical protein GCM10008940_10940 [Microbulbifer agarilyticus]
MLLVTRTGTGGAYPAKCLSRRYKPEAGSQRGRKFYTDDLAFASLVDAIVLTRRQPVPHGRCDWIDGFEGGSITLRQGQ